MSEDGHVVRYNGVFATFTRAWKSVGRTIDRRRLRRLRSMARRDVVLAVERKRGLPGNHHNIRMRVPLALGCPRYVTLRSLQEMLSRF